MSTCKTCRWWGVGQEYPLESWVREEQRSVAANCKACGCPGIVNVEFNEKGYHAIGSNGCGLDYPVCALVTGPDFGCTNHEPATIAAPTIVDTP